MDLIITIISEKHSPTLTVRMDNEESALFALHLIDVFADEVSLEDEIILYTDGITDANNTEHEIYGEERLTDFLNNHESGENIIMDLINDINKFTNGEKQFDDMTLLILDIK